MRNIFRLKYTGQYLSTSIRLVKSTVSSIYIYIYIVVYATNLLTLRLCSPTTRIHITGETIYYSVISCEPDYTHACRCNHRQTAYILWLLLDLLVYFLPAWKYQLFCYISITRMTCTTADGAIAVIGLAVWEIVAVPLNIWYFCLFIALL